MEPFVSLTAVVAPYYFADVDTDRIIPHRFLRKPLSAGYRNFLFHDERLDAEGRERPDFVLNRPPYRSARILVGGRNFGCGSAREGAVYALQDRGFRAVIAPSYADFFRENCMQNGVLPVVLDESIVAAIAGQIQASPGSTVAIDLPGQVVRAPDGTRHRFEIDPSRKEQLLRGLDDIGLTLQRTAAIGAFENAYYRRVPWLRPVALRQ
ncbi:MAG: 3-isopropylmalate dehydratase small subunit [Betaproteobacteria bacterium RIFCSPLOWO2_12_FULL_63_13]|nr:MAG: 3-isopropylmalate dehydratase small subunit [Betaproteobacteria bacterium RIFCSPLOWO2_12_FULL_63_13]